MHQRAHDSRQAKVFHRVRSSAEQRSTSRARATQNATHDNAPSIVTRLVFWGPSPITSICCKPAYFDEGFGGGGRPSDCNDLPHRAQGPRPHSLTSCGSPPRGDANIVDDTAIVLPRCRWRPRTANPTFFESLREKRASVRSATPTQAASRAFRSSQ